MHIQIYCQLCLPVSGNGYHTSQFSTKCNGFLNSWRHSNNKEFSHYMDIGNHMSSYLVIPPASNFCPFNQIDKQ